MRGWLVILGLGVAAVTTVRASATPPLPPPADQQLARDMLQGLVEINTTHAHGSTEAAKAIQGWLLSAGFAPGDVIFLAPPDHPTKGNIVVRYHGRQAKDRVLFLGHLDVVEAKPEDWSVDPFKLTQQDGWFYGRGTIDMKDGIALLESHPMKREKFVPTTMSCRLPLTKRPARLEWARFLLKEHRDSDRCQIVLDSAAAASKRGTAPTRYTSRRPTSAFSRPSAGGHGSARPDNAIYKLAAGRLEAFKFPVALTATTRASFDALAALKGSIATDMHGRAIAPDLAAAGGESKRAAQCPLVPPASRL